MLVFILTVVESLIVNHLYLLIMLLMELMELLQIIKLTFMLNLILNQINLTSILLNLLQNRSEKITH
uniref:Uncharacterized protein n=1 Tax=virus sp. ctrcb4 TaxID=2825824 RepID=A0A8S5RQF7_9VIRU|nr:MAG TPA: hypothetical protein [virus sp. ctrcb4]